MHVVNEGVIALSRIPGQGHGSLPRGPDDQIDKLCGVLYCTCYQVSSRLAKPGPPAAHSAPNRKPPRSLSVPQPQPAHHDSGNRRPNGCHDRPRPGPRSADVSPDRQKAPSHPKTDGGQLRCPPSGGRTPHGRHTRCRPSVLTAPQGAVKTQVGSVLEPIFMEAWQPCRPPAKRADFRISPPSQWSRHHAG